jgi:NAD(P)-dependent dehydrogenase (short-subunit alcohol dehydrogenase family)
MALTAHQALVTGGTKGIGRSVVRRLARGDDAPREDAARAGTVNMLGEDGAACITGPCLAIPGCLS